MILAAILAPWSVRFAPAAAQDDDDPASKSLSLELDNQTLVDSLKLLFKSVGANYVIDPTVMRGASQARVSLSIGNQPFLQALESVLNAGSAGGSGLSYRLENGIYTITTREGAAPPAVAPPSSAPSVATPRPLRVTSSSKSRVTLSLQHKNLDEALRMLFDAANVDFVIPLRTQTGGAVTMSMTNMPFEGALLGILKSVELAAPLTSQEVGAGIFALTSGHGSRPESVRLSLNFTQANLRDALSAVFKAAGANFTIDQNVRGASVTLKLHDVTLKSAADMLLKSSGITNHVVSSAGGVYHVGGRSR